MYYLGSTRRVTIGCKREGWVEWNKDPKKRHIRKAASLAGGGKGLAARAGDKTGAPFMFNVYGVNKILLSLVIEVYRKSGTAYCTSLPNNL